MKVRVLPRCGPRGSLYKSTSDARTPPSPSVVNVENALPGGGTLSHTNIILREGRVFRLPMYYVIVVTWILFNYCFDVFIGTIDDYATDKQMGFLRTISILPILSTTDIFRRRLSPSPGRQGVPESKRSTQHRLTSASESPRRFCLW
ncbi:hypothetical protein MTO96_040411 [Rhipicephalus appendiculatus]